MNTQILTYDDIKNIKFGNVHEPLVNVGKYDSAIVCEYEKFDMVPYTGFDILVRDTIAKKLADVNGTLMKQGLCLKVAYGYRALRIQNKYFAKRMAELKAENVSMDVISLERLTHNYVAAPDLAGHVLGAAIDLTLIDNNGSELDMGTSIADYSNSDLIRTFSKNISADQAINRQILLKEMVSVGFAPFLGEWWHFSYGDKEWAAYYGKDRSLYPLVELIPTSVICTIAGGNCTAIQVVDTWKGSLSNRKGCESLIAFYPEAEQAGIFYKDVNRLEMAGGEFCGNATAALAAYLNMKSFYISGFEGRVVADTNRINDSCINVELEFNDINYVVSNKLINNLKVKIVEFDGITHVLIEKQMPSRYKTVAKNYISRLRLIDRDAVGVIWYEKVSDTQVKIDPVVWVRDIDTLFYESSCGSGSMAAAIGLQLKEVIQPSGQSINVDTLSDKIKTCSSIKILSKSISEPNFTSVKTV